MPRKQKAKREINKCTVRIERKFLFSSERYIGFKWLWAQTDFEEIELKSRYRLHLKDRESNNDNYDTIMYHRIIEL